MSAASIRRVLLTAALVLATIYLPGAAQAHASDDSSGVGVTVEIPSLPEPATAPGPPSLGQTGPGALRTVAVAAIALIGLGVLLRLYRREPLPHLEGE